MTQHSAGTSPATPSLLPPGSPEIPSSEDCTVGELLRVRADVHPERTFAIFDTGVEWTYRDMWTEACRVARGLKAIGIGHGDRVACWLPNGPECLATWFGANLLGATFVPINTAFRGGILAHALTNVECTVVVAHAELLTHLDNIDVPGLSSIVVVGDAVSTSRPHISFDTWHDDSPLEIAQTQPWDSQMIIFTSGTTGPSKGVLLSYVHHYSCAVAAFDRQFTDDERYLVHLPLYHVGGTMGVYAMLLYGGSIVVQSMFRTEAFWDVVRRHGVTSCTLLGVMATFLLKQPPRDDDTDNPLRWLYLVPLVDDAHTFAARFGVDVYAIYNMTEVSCPLISAKNPTAIGACGRVQPGTEVRLVDAHDVPVPPGEVGELVVRTARPWSMNSGYNAMPEATARAWRNGWFHTGDAMYQGPAGDFYFVDRMKDTIRRRGENISSFEVEAEALAHESVAEAAALAVPSELGEDEVLLAVALVEGHELAPEDLLMFLRPRMAYFMLPRFIRFLDELPRTPTSKVRKVELREEGLTPQVWDREAAGISIKQERIG